MTKLYLLLLRNSLGDDLPASAPEAERKLWLANWGNLYWRFSTGISGRNLLNPKENGYLAVALIWAPKEDISSPTYFTANNLNPLSGNLNEVIMRQTVDVAFFRGKNAPEYCHPLQNIFFNVVNSGNTLFMETLLLNNDKSNSYCGEAFLTPGLQKFFQITQSTRGRENICEGNFVFLNT